MAQVNATVGDLDGNAGLIVEWTRRAAARGARVVVLPEMMLTGYPVEDLALRASFVEASIAALRGVAGRQEGVGLRGMAGVVGTGPAGPASICAGQGITGIPVPGAGAATVWPRAADVPARIKHSVIRSAVMVIPRRLTGTLLSQPVPLVTFSSRRSALP